MSPGNCTAKLAGARRIPICLAGGILVVVVVVVCVGGGVCAWSSELTFSPSSA